jgi:predicted DNA-binding antitoxin AbrB/MazE fold protein
MATVRRTGGIQAVDAVFEHGIFRPLAPANLALSEGQRVRLVVETMEPGGDALALATQVYDGLSEQEIDEIEHIALDRRDFFGSRAIDE